MFRFALVLGRYAASFALPSSRVPGSVGFWRGGLFGLVGVICCFGWVAASPGIAEGVPIKLAQPVEGFEEFDTRDVSRGELKNLAVVLRNNYAGERGNVERIHRAIRNNDYRMSGSTDRSSVIGQRGGVWCTGLLGFLGMVIYTGWSALDPTLAQGNVVAFAQPVNPFQGAHEFLQIDAFGNPPGVLPSPAAAYFQDNGLFGGNPSRTQLDDLNIQEIRLNAAGTQGVCLIKAGEVRARGFRDLVARYEGLAEEFWALVGSDDPTKTQLEDLYTRQRKLDAEYGQQWCLTIGGQVRDDGLGDLAVRYEGLAEEFRVLADSDNPTKTQLEDLNTKQRKPDAESIQRLCLTNAGEVRDRGLEDLAARYERLAEECRVLADSDNPTKTQLEDLFTKWQKLRAEEEQQECLTEADKVRDRGLEDLAARYKRLADEFRVLADSDNPTETQFENLWVKKLAEDQGRLCPTYAGEVRGRGLGDLAARFERLAEEFRVLADSDNPTRTQLFDLQTKWKKLHREFVLSRR